MDNRNEKNTTNISVNPTAESSSQTQKLYNTNPSGKGCTFKSAGSLGESNLIKRDCKTQKRFHLDLPLVQACLQQAKGEQLITSVA
jgi:hypothetical protein